MLKAGQGGDSYPEVAGAGALARHGNIADAAWDSGRVIIGQPVLSEFHVGQLLGHKTAPDHIVARLCAVPGVVGWRVLHAWRSMELYAVHVSASMHMHAAGSF